MVVAQIPSLLTDTIWALRRHFHDTVLPAWMTHGFNPQLGLPCESLDGATGLPLPTARYRAMACAR